MKSLLFLIILLVILLYPSSVFAIQDPLIPPNNKIGVHILFTSEIETASSLINSNGGDWGYVTIPIQAGDKNLEKWQKFMNSAKQNHVIPIIRLATEGDYFNTSIWKKPTREDVLDFANFLNSLDWPVKNRYVVIFNEVNRGDEWQGSPNPQEYAILLKYAVDTFQSLNEDFFIISAGLDNASANEPGKSMNQYDFMAAMNSAVHGIFGLIDGLGSHSYPNPAFSQAPWSKTNMSINSFKYERNLARELSQKNLPVFITETGWSSDKLTHSQIARNFEYAFEFVWSDSSIVAVTPFLLRAGNGPFFQFSLLDENGGYNEISKSLSNLPKIKGEPKLNFFTDSSFLSSSEKELPTKSFSQKRQYTLFSQESTETITDFFKWLLKLSE